MGSTFVMECERETENTEHSYLNYRSKYGLTPSRGCGMGKMCSLQMSNSAIWAYIWISTCTQSTASVCIDWVHELEVEGLGGGVAKRTEHNRERDYEREDWRFGEIAKSKGMG